VQKGLALQQCAEACRSLAIVLLHGAKQCLIIHTRNLPRNCAADLGLCILEELDEGRDEVSVDDLFVDSFRNLDSVSARPV
jgi:hypothetical protein